MPLKRCTNEWSYNLVPVASRLWCEINADGYSVTSKLYQCRLFLMQKLGFFRGKNFCEDKLYGMYHFMCGCYNLRSHPVAVE